MQNNSNETVVWLNYKARYLMRNRLQNKLKDCGISTEQWSILSRVCTKEGCNQKELAASSLKDRAVVTRILNILEKKKLVQREISHSDRREFLLYPTEQGQVLYGKALAVINRNNEEIDSIFSENDLEQLKHLLTILTSKLV
jgi:MarR family transcriptional regulator for hemolysin